MGHYEYSGIDPRLSVAKVRECLASIASELWGESMRIVDVDGIPVTPGDNRLAKWAFWPAGPPEWPDAAFSISLVKRSGSLQLEFKTPVSDQGKGWQKQIRRIAKCRLNMVAVA